MQFGIPNLSCTAIYESAPKDASARGKAIDTTRMQYVWRSTAQRQVSASS
jgi:hypothetical protein